MDQLKSFIEVEDFKAEKADMIELKQFLLGREFSRDTTQLSLFERVLATPKASGLIQAIWDKLGLHFRDEILSLVRLDISKMSFYNLLALVNREILMENIFSSTCLMLTTIAIC